MGRMLRSPTRRARGGALALLLAVLAAVALPAAADPESRLERIERKQSELDRKIEAAAERKGTLLEKIRVVDDERSRVETVVGSLESELRRLNAEISEVTQRLTRTQQQIAVLHNELEQILSRLVTRTELFTERAVVAYKAGPTAYLDTLVSAESVGDLIDRYSYYEAVLDADSELIEEIEVLRSETEQKRAEVEEKEERIAADKRLLEADRARVTAIRAEKASALAGLEDVLASKRSLLASVEEKKSSYERVQAQLERESEEIQNLLAAAAAPSAAPTRSYGGGTFAWPAPGPVTSGFGYRIHPIFGDQRLHTGVDISAPYGASVVAADSGTVVYAGVMSGYGNVIVIDHGGGIATTYNHLSQFYVGSGQGVDRASSVGAVGCTGYCTGPHLHFEVRVNGTPVDPMPYLR